MTVNYFSGISSNILCPVAHYIYRGGAAGTAGTALAGPLFMAIRPHPQLNFCGLGLESTLSFMRVFTFYQNKSILLENNGSH